MEIVKLSFGRIWKKRITDHDFPPPFVKCWVRKITRRRFFQPSVFVNRVPTENDSDFCSAESISLKYTFLELPPTNVSSFNSRQKMIFVGSSFRLHWSYKIVVAKVVQGVKYPRSSVALRNASSGQWFPVQVWHC